MAMNSECRHESRAAGDSDRGAQLSVVVVSFNSTRVLTDCLAGLRSAMPAAEVIVVDNASADSSLGVARSWADVCIPNETNLGFGAAVNLGVRQARRPLALVLNPDAVLGEIDWAGVADLTQRAEVGLLACLVVHDGRTQDQLPVLRREEAEALWTLISWLLVPRGLHLPRPPTFFGRPLRWVPGAAFIVRPSEFLAVGGFNEAIFLYYEDADLSRRYHGRGLPVGVSRAITVHHSVGQSSPREWVAVAEWNMLSLVEVAAGWRGQRAGQRVASLVVRVLSGVKVISVAFGRVPVLGPRARRKGADAEKLRSRLLAAATEGRIDGAYYLAARRAFRTLS